MAALRLTFSRESISCLIDLFPLISFVRLIYRCLSLTKSIKIFTPLSMKMFYELFISQSNRFFLTFVIFFLLANLLIYHGWFSPFNSLLYFGCFFVFAIIDESVLFTHKILTIYMQSYISRSREGNYYLLWSW